jgi:hypothetical protein
VEGKDWEDGGSRLAWAKKSCETPFQPIKVGHGGMSLSSQIYRKHKQEDHSPGVQGHKFKTPFEKYLKQKGLEA